MPPKHGAEEQEPTDIDFGSDIEPVKAPVKAESTRTNKKSWVWQYFQPSKSARAED
ncbi:hypothetical protein PGT21_003671 [Puccinia graminis f. sp. tritici]|uniref:Uncharacterized protein n=1 Tax=Puccinia graminis f. sp. tritici TaxID=56615 RepID=A0A5B0QWR7_PUCGR|nr:hypothetical protein PGT21_003455 [Puccinia graminis f. sp. tritici]KAA1117325.1 hypothetical protein PGT21_003671 [Puccinia graminis f. sp. tritici]